MDKIKIRTSFVSFPSPIFGEGDTCPIDQSPAKDFNIDPYTGRPTEEITKAMRAQTAAEQQTLFMNLTQYKGDFLPESVEPREALKFMKPSLCQLPSELAEWQESLTKFELDTAKQKQDAEELDKIRKSLQDVAEPSSIEPSNPS